MTKVIPIARAKLRPVEGVERLLTEASDANYLAAVIVGQTSDGSWSLQFTNLFSKVEMIGILEFIKIEEV